MRPVLLEFAGLHSYRDKQVVDFAELGAYGLFGVFGPTGSGKSTILDAITLALFGKVDRADRGTRAIVNQQEKKASVSFTFELAGVRYRAERAYETDAANPVATRAKQARLVKMASGAELEVLADKPSDMDKEVAELLGMSMDDFTHAVVLPQGQFDKFLKLTEGDRARMLEHIFGLEQYGDQLAQKTRGKVAALASELLAIAAEKQGLGDASAETVAQAEQRLLGCEETVRTREKEKAEADAALASQSELKRLAEQKDRLLARQSELEAESAAVARKRARLDAANRAEPLRQFIDREKALAERARRGERDVLEAQAALRTEQEAMARATTRRDEARESHDKEAPEIQRRLHDCEAAAEDDRRRREMEQQREKRSAALVETQGHLAKTRASSETAERALGQLKAELARLSDERQKVVVTPEERQAVTAAAEALAALENAEQQAGDAEDMLARKAAALKTKRKALRATLRRQLDEATLRATGMDSLDAAAPGREGDVVATAAQVAEAVSIAAARAGEEARTALRAAEEERRELDRRHLAAVLASGLEAGEPCPVCGSHEHPKPATPPADVQELLERAEEDLRVARERVDSVSAWDKDVERGLAAFRAAAEEVAGTFAPEAAKKRDAAVRLAEELDRIRGDLGRDEIRPRQQDISNADRALAKLDELRALKDAEREATEAQLRELQKAAENDAVQIQGLKTEVASLDELIGALSARVSAVTGGRDLAELQAELARALASLKEALTHAEEAHEAARTAAVHAQRLLAALESTAAEVGRQLDEVRRDLAAGLVRAGFAGSEDARTAMLGELARSELAREVEEHSKERDVVARQLKEVDSQLGGRVFDADAFARVEARANGLAEELETLQGEAAVAAAEVRRLRDNHERWQELEEARKKAEHTKELAAHLAKLLEGRKFVQFLAEEHLRDMVVEASRRLGALTGQRYALELDEGCGFLMRDDFMGGQRRPVGSLSGGETFLTSLAMALALSGKIQLRGKYPLGFFFLDEGFGTLDREKLELVMATLQKLHDSERMVGVISHVPELREQLPVYLEVTPTDAAGRGSRVVLRKG